MPCKILVRSHVKKSFGFLECWHKDISELTVALLMADDGLLRFGIKAFKRVLTSLSFVKCPRVVIIFSRENASVSNKASSGLFESLFKCGNKFCTYALHFFGLKQTKTSK